jgi:hypothetical protein
MGRRNWWTDGTEWKPGVGSSPLLVLGRHRHSVGVLQVDTERAREVHFSSSSCQNHMRASYLEHHSIELCLEKCLQWLDSMQINPDEMHKLEVCFVRCEFVAHLLRIVVLLQTVFYLFLVTVRRVYRRCPNNSTASRQQLPQAVVCTRRQTRSLSLSPTNTP